MSDRKCIELTAVYDDGIIARWEGDDAEYMETEASSVMAYSAGPWRQPTTTRPLRKVTTVRGIVFDPCDGGANHIRPIPEDDDLREVSFDGIIPPGADIAQGGAVHWGPLCDFRITVEGVPVEEE